MFVLQGKWNVVQHSNFVPQEKCTIILTFALMITLTPTIILSYTSTGTQTPRHTLTYARAPSFSLARSHSHSLCLSLSLSYTQTRRTLSFHPKHTSGNSAKTVRVRVCLSIPLYFFHTISLFHTPTHFIHNTRCLSLFNTQHIHTSFCLSLSLSHTHTRAHFSSLSLSLLPSNTHTHTHTHTHNTRSLSHAHTPVWRVPRLRLALAIKISRCFSELHDIATCRPT